MENCFWVETRFEEQEYSRRTGEPLPREVTHYIRKGGIYVCHIQGFPGARQLAELAAQAWNYHSPNTEVPIRALEF